MKPIIALMGRAQCGKDTIGSAMCENGAGVTVAFADKLKEVCGDLFGLAPDDMATDAAKNKATGLTCLRCPACGSIEIVRHAGIQVECKGCTLLGDLPGFESHWTPRMILQHIGTEGFRRVDPQVWVRATLRKIDSLLALPNPPGFVVITDCRFRSEADAVWSAGGQVWRIRRPFTDNAARGLGGHASETEMDTIPDTLFQRVIHNDATLEHIQNKARVAATDLSGPR